MSARHFFAYMALFVMYLGACFYFDALAVAAGFALGSGMQMVLAAHNRATLTRATAEPGEPNG